MAEIVAAHLERVAKETVAPYRQMAKEIIDKLPCSETARESVQQATMARWDDLEQVVAAALAACAREARRDEAILIREEYLDLGGWELVDKKGFDKHVAALERAAGEKA